MGNIGPWAADPPYCIVVLGTVSTSGFGACGGKAGTQCGLSQLEGATIVDESTRELYSIRHCSSLCYFALPSVPVVDVCAQTSTPQAPEIDDIDTPPLPQDIWLTTPRKAVPLVVTEIRKRMSIDIVVAGRVATLDPGPTRPWVDRPSGSGRGCCSARDPGSRPGPAALRSNHLMEIFRNDLTFKQPSSLSSTSIGGITILGSAFDFGVSVRILKAGGMNYPHKQPSPTQARGSPTRVSATRPKPDPTLTTLNHSVYLALRKLASNTTGSSEDQL
ncbi:hypothetical protein R3P38DRAFT_2790672 [Favolaschia claudopus]|uniref:Uncharacterized protein n=1 Tax=Favolaschia claudopus TaxID=2862362 RepID=A0AAW0AI73_9AGAR